MIVKNISGSTRTFQLGQRTGITLANNASRTIDDAPETLVDVLRYAKEGLLQITSAPTLEAFQPVAGPQVIEVSIKVPVDTNTLTLGTVVFEFDDNDTTTAGRVEVDIGAAPADTAATLAALINANATLSALGISVRETVDLTGESILIVIVPSTVTLSSFTASVSNSAQTSVTKVNATAPVPVRTVLINSAVTAGEVTATRKIITTGLDTITHVSLQVREADGTILANDGAVIIDGGTITLDRSGSVDFASTNIVTGIAFGF